MLKEALILWKKERDQKGTTLHRRLILFFASISVFLILSIVALLIAFGITGKEKEVVLTHLDTELAFLSHTIAEDFGRISLNGIEIAEEISKRCDDFFSDHEMCAADLQRYPERIEPLLADQAQTLINTINNHYCGGVFILLDATIAPTAKQADTAKAGIFLKKTQPTSTGSIGVDIHYLRGPAQIARDNEIMLLGQWRMEYDISDQTFFTDVMETARQNPDLPLSRLYYWSGRVTLKGNSEAGFLLCVPLRSDDGTVFGLCGIEISDRMFKSLYSPEAGAYDSMFTAVAPTNETDICTSAGLIAGNYYLTGNRWNTDMTYREITDEMVWFQNEKELYGGKCESLRLYPYGSPYETQAWQVAVLMPQEEIDRFSQGSEPYFFYTVLGLLVLSLVVSFFISKHYLKPVTDALHSIRNVPHEERKAAPYLEINDLLEFLASKDKDHEEALRETAENHQRILSEYEKAQLELSRLAYSRKQEVDPDLYQQFLDHLYSLTPTEREIFDLYIGGKTVKEIMEIMYIKENTLKYHNKNIYSKLGVTSRKELLRYAALMSQDQKQTQTNRPYRSK